MRVFTAGLETGGVIEYELGPQCLRLKKLGVVGSQEGRQSHIQKMTRFEYKGSKYLILAKKGLVLDVYLDAPNETFRLICSKTLISNQVKSDFFIGLEVNYEVNSITGERQGWVRCCTGFGYCYFIELEKLMGSNYENFSMSFGMCGFVGFFHMFKFDEGNDNEIWKIVYGGKDRAISVLEMKDNCNIWKSKCVKASSCPRLKKHESNGLLSEPAWIQEVLLVNENQNFDDLKILAVTKSGQLFKYFPFLSKFPIDEYQVFDQTGIKNIIQLNGNLVLMNDGFNNVVLFDLKRWEIVDKCEMITGSLSTLKSVEVDISLLSETTDTVEFVHLILIASNVDFFLRTYIIFKTQGSLWQTKLISKEPTMGTISQLFIENESATDLPIQQIRAMINKYTTPLSKHTIIDDETSSYMTKRSRIV